MLSERAGTSVEPKASQKRAADMWESVVFMRTMLTCHRGKAYKGEEKSHSELAPLRNRYIWPDGDMILDRIDPKSE